MILTEIILFVVLWALGWYALDQKRYRNYPPGPFRLPFLGSIIQVVTKARLPAEALIKLAKQHGDVMFLKMGSNESVVFSSREVVREILAHDKSAARLRPPSIQDKYMDQNLGIIWSSGKSWLGLRRFTIRNLRDFGFGKSSVTDVMVNEEVSKFIAHTKAQAKRNPGNVVHIQSDWFGMSMEFVLWRLVSGKSYPLDDPVLERFVKLNDQFFRETNFGFSPSDTFPWLRSLFPNWSGKNKIQHNSRTLFECGKELIKAHRGKGDAESFIDVFASKVEKEKNNNGTYFTEDQFVMTILDLILAGAETSSKTLTFGMLYMIAFPEVQEKVQMEIDQVVPKDSLIDSTFRAKLPYTEATLFEIFRYSTIAPTPGPREATEDFYFRGYFIKKGTSLMTNVQAIHFSESLWGDPQNFRPERFLNSEGTGVDPNIADQLETFGNGKRVCLGQSLAETTTFTYFASMLRQFKLSKVDGVELSLEPILGITYTPQPFDIQVEERH